MRQFGDPISILPFGIKREREDILYYDGPILSIYQTDKGEFLVYYWCESNYEVNRWLVFEINELEAKLLRNDAITITELVRLRDFVFFVDVDSELKHKSIRKLHPVSIPPSYLPEIQLTSDISYFQVLSPIPSNYSAVQSFMRSIGSVPNSDRFFEFNDINGEKSTNVSLSAYHMA
jgi:hypothetical protein